MSPTIYTNVARSVGGGGGEAMTGESRVAHSNNGKVVCTSISTNNNVNGCSNNTAVTAPVTSTITKQRVTITHNVNYNISGICNTNAYNNSAIHERVHCAQPSLPFTSTALFQLLCVICACALCYWNASQCLLVFDDISAIRDNKDLRPSTPLKQIFLNDFWGTPMRKEQSHKSYRPLTVLTFRINYYLHELQPYGYHIINVVLHMAVCVLWRRVSRLLVLHCIRSELLAQRVSWLSALLFAIHPIHTEAVTGVVGRAELLSSLFYLCAFLSYACSVRGSNASSTPPSAVSSVNRKFSKIRTQWYSLSWCFGSSLLASLLCKEQGITIAGICMAYELFVVHQVQPLQLWQALLNVFEEKPFNTSSNSRSNSNSSSNNSNNSSPSYKASKTVHLTTSNSSLWTCGLSTTRYGLPRTTPLGWSSSLVKRLSFLVIITVTLLVGRVYVMGSQLPVFTRFDNPASAAETPIRQLTYSYLIFLNFWLLLFPCDLCCDWTMGTVPLIDGLMDVRNICTLITFICLVFLLTRACITHNLLHSRMLLMCLVWTVAPFLPASNLFFPVGFVVAERILYMPSMGFCLLVAYGYECLKEKCYAFGHLWKYMLNAGLFLLLLTHGLRTHQRNYDWLNEYTLFMSGVHVNNRNAKLFNNVGHALENEGRFNEALSYFQQAVLIQPDDIGAHINVGRTYNNLKSYGEAEAAYLKAKSLFPRIKPGESYQARIAPNHLNVFINLANLIARNQSRLEEADFLYRQAISMRADYVQAYINRGDILMKLNRTAQAQEVYEKALLYDSENADIYYNLGVVFLEQGKSAQANVYFNKAIELSPDHEQALLNSAILLQEIGGSTARQLSRERLHAVLLKRGDNEKVFFNLGMLAMDDSNFQAAEDYFKRAIHLKENFRSALFNLALLLADTNRPLDAVPFLNQLIRHHPDHIKGLILLGDIYINHMKDLDAAESCYRSILQYEPRNVQGLHNLCVVFVERKHLVKARDCLRHVYSLSPSEDYILRHLQIVETRLQKISSLPDNAAEKLLAFHEYHSHDFLLPSSTITKAIIAPQQQQQQQQQQQLEQSKSQSSKTSSAITSTTTNHSDKSKILPSRQYNS